MGFKLSSLVKPALAAAAGYMTGGASGAVTGAVGVGSDMLSSAESLAQQKKLADYNFSQNVAMWNLNNAYNDPSAQMARLEKSGLNKNLVYGGGNVTGNTSGSTPTYDAGNYQPVDKSIQRQQLTLALKEHQQRITNQAIENELARERIGLAQRDADRQDRLADAQIKAYAAGLGLTDARIYDIEHDNNGPQSQVGKMIWDAGKLVKEVGKGVKYIADNYSASAREGHKTKKTGHTNFITGERF